MNSNVTKEEIREAIFSIGKTKAPGSDRLSALFYHNFWDICKEDVYRMVMEAFDSINLPPNLNETFIVLIPKVQSSCVNHLRLISLCNTLFLRSLLLALDLSLSRLLVRLKPVLSQVGKSWITLSSSKRCSINSGILKRLKVMSLGKLIYPRPMIEWTGSLSLTCLRKWEFMGVSLVNYKALINGEAFECFSPACGLRQGDPLSLCLFVIGMEKLSQIINYKVKKNE